MNQIKMAVLFAAIAAVAIGTGTLSISATPLLVAGPASSILNSGSMIGHVTLIQYDSNGNVIAYRQTDNFISNNGEDCAVFAIFGGTAGTSEQCTNTLGSFNFVAIGNGTGAAAVTQNALQGNEVASRAQDTEPAYTAANGATSDGTVIVSQSFTGVTDVVEEAGLFDASTTGNMFARQLTGTINLSSGDTLQVDWTITLGGNTNP